MHWMKLEILESFEQLLDNNMTVSIDKVIVVLVLYFDIN